eukprot:2122607-Rhodomonas_salina.1
MSRYQEEDEYDEEDELDADVQWEQGAEEEQYEDGIYEYEDGIMESEEVEGDMQMRGDEVILAAYLEKKGGGRISSGYRKRFFVLYDEEVMYFKDEKAFMDGKPEQGQISLLMGAEVSSEGFEQGRYLLLIRDKTNRRNFEIACPTELKENRDALTAHFTAPGSSGPMGARDRRLYRTQVPGLFQSGKSVNVNVVKLTLLPDQCKYPPRSTTAAQSKESRRNSAKAQRWGQVGRRHSEGRNSKNVVRKHRGERYLQELQELDRTFPRCQGGIFREVWRRWDQGIGATRVDD